MKIIFLSTRNCCLSRYHYNEQDSHWRSLNPDQKFQKMKQTIDSIFHFTFQVSTCKSQFTLQGWELVSRVNVMTYWQWEFYVCFDFGRMYKVLNHNLKICHVHCAINLILATFGITQLYLKMQTKLKFHLEKFQFMKVNWFFFKISLLIFKADLKMG